MTLLYSRNYFNETSRQAVINLVEDVRRAFIDMLGDVTWMDNETRVNAIKKAYNAVAHVGYPSGIFENHEFHEYYGPLEIMKPDNYFQNSLKLNIFNTRQMFKTLHKPVNRSGWETVLDLKPNEANAFYQPGLNAMRMYFIYKK